MFATFTHGILKTKFQTNADHIPDQIKSLQMKTLVQQLQVRLTPRCTLRMARQLGRELEQVKAWQKQISRFLPTFYVAKIFYGPYESFQKKVRHTKTSTGGVPPFAERMILWFCVHLANCGFGIFLVWSKSAKNEELFAPPQLVMTPIGSAFMLWNHIENIIVWFGYYEITFQVYYI